MLKKKYYPYHETVSLEYIFMPIHIINFNMIYNSWTNKILSLPWNCKNISSCPYISSILIWYITPGPIKYHPYHEVVRIYLHAHTYHHALSFLYWGMLLNNVCCDTSSCHLLTWPLQKRYLICDKLTSFGFLLKYWMWQCRLSIFPLWDVIFMMWDIYARGAGW